MRITVNFFEIITISLLSLVVVNSRSANDEFRTTGERLSIESNSIRLVTETGRPTTDSRSLKRVFLSNRTVTCNDGSQAGFYLRKSSGSKRWVVFFEGGWHCYDLKSCRARWLRLRHYMTSAQWPETRDVGGILSPLASENPYWHDANHVIVPYCSSDSWSGTKVNADRDGWKFMGSLIVRQVMADLIPLGLGRNQGSELLMAGSSAGGLGVMLNLDKVRKFLHEERGINVIVRGVSDSGWFLDREPYIPGAIASSEGVRLGWKLWEGALPEACTAVHQAEPWRCYFGHRLYGTLKSPLFIFQWIFDEEQMNADSVGAPVTPQQWDYIHEMGGALRASLDNVTAVFAPSCIGHSVLTKRDWLNIKIDDISLAEALRCWEQATKREGRLLSGQGNGMKNMQKKKRRKKNEQRKERRNGRQNNKNNQNEQRPRLTKEERQQRKLKRERKQNKNNQRTTKTPMTSIIPKTPTLREFKEHQEPSENNNLVPPGVIQRNRRRKNDTNTHNHNRNRNHNNHKRQQNRSRKRSPTPIQEPKRCSLRLLERCSWPQCNNSCPALTNPLTGEEMKFLELLASFGLDIEAVATALGVDMQTLNNMDHTELVNLLTQQVS